MVTIHASSVVEDGADIGSDVRIGPFCLVGKDVRLADGVVLESHITITGLTAIGERTRIFPFASIGHAPQDLKYRGERTRLEIGRDNVIREHVTMNPGTAGGGGLTRIGHGGLFMIGVHVAHDCQIGDRVIMANNATLAGHVEIGDGAVLGGLSAVHQFVRIGAGAMVGGMSGVEHDVIPYGLVMGERARLAGLNLVGLKRRGLGREAIRELQTAYDRLFAHSGTLSERAEDLSSAAPDASALAEILAFIQAESRRSILQPGRDKHAG